MTAPEDDLRAVTNVVRALGGCADIESATRAALDAVRSAFGWAYGSFWQIDPSDGLLHCAVESGDAGPEFREVTRTATFREGVGLSGRAWRTRELVAVEDLGTMTDCVRAPIAQKVGVRSGVCFPLLLHGRVIGTMDFFSLSTLQPSASQLDALRTVATLVGQTLEQLQRASAAGDVAAEATAVIGVLEEMSTAPSSDAAVRAALETVRNAFGWEYGSYWQIDPQHSALKFAVESGDVGPQFREVTLAASFKIGVGLSGRAWKTRDLVFVPDLGQVTDCVRAPVAQKVGVHSGVCFPVIVLGEVVGTMDFFSMQTLQLSETRLATLRRVSRLVSQTLERLNNAEQAANAAGRLIESIEQISASSTQAVSATAAAVERVRRAREAVSELGQSSAEIGGVANMITSIAKQTNLLALNATIEAARAGEAGKGFAVVASEVKDLAQQTGQATTDIQTRITAIQAGTTGAVDGIGAIADAVNDVQEVNRRIAEIIDSQSAVTQAFLSRSGR